MSGVKSFTKTLLEYYPDSVHRPEPLGPIVIFPEYGRQSKLISAGFRDWDKGKNDRYPPPLKITFFFVRSLINKQSPLSDFRFSPISGRLVASGTGEKNVYLIENENIRCTYKYNISSFCVFTILVYKSNC